MRILDQFYKQTYNLQSCENIIWNLAEKRWADFLRATDCWFKWTSWTSWTSYFSILLKKKYFKHVHSKLRYVAKRMRDWASEQLQIFWCANDKLTLIKIFWHEKNLVLGWTKKTKQYSSVFTVVFDECLRLNKKKM